ncbi:hypothetical protein niasHT_033785 [Heterodera trifolii]|uniref:Thioredoxin domain-containing protein n=1 Tax=Heterodera trifolii TaxID=157864 RepID=A0ABD2J7C8_9BILA
MAQLFENIGVRRKLDDQLVNGQEALQGCEVVALYFSAHWCPPCRNFTPVLKQFYDELKKSPETAPFEIVFVSFDRSADDLSNYLRESHGDWLYIPHGSEHIETLSKKFGISGIPALVVLKKDGTLVTKDGRADVQNLSPSNAMAKWRSG